MLLGFNPNNKDVNNSKLTATLEKKKMATMQNFDPHFCVVFHVRKY